MRLSKNRLQLKKIKRSSSIENSEDLDYFEGLSLLLSNGGSVLEKMNEIVDSNGEFINEKRTISNFIKKIKRNLLLPMKRVEEIRIFYEMFVEKGFKFETSNSSLLVS